MSVEGTFVNKQEVKRRLEWALDRLYEEDSCLLALDANERSITHRLGMYLQEAFPNWDVDCEYNRKGHDPEKLRLQEQQITSGNTDGDTVFPDIIVHHRTKTHDNLLVVEVKKTTSTASDDRDIQKLDAFRSELKYCYAVFLKLHIGKNIINREHMVTSMCWH